MENKNYLKAKQDYDLIIHKRKVWNKSSILKKIVLFIVAKNPQPLVDDYRLEILKDIMEQTKNSKIKINRTHRY